MTERKGLPTPVADLAGLIGQEIGVSRWITVDQARIDAFAEITEDRQFIHIDPVAAAHTPFGGTIAHGFLTLSLLSAMTYDAVPPLEGVVMGVNYGFDKLRFLAPVPAGSVVGRHVPHEQRAVALVSVLRNLAGSQRGEHGAAPLFTNLNAG